jgi:hypothetical protein
LGTAHGLQKRHTKLRKIYPRLGRFGTGSP